MELATYTIPWKAKDAKPVVICPLGDIQYAGKGGSTATDTLKRYIDRAMEQEAWFVGTGDYIDFASPSNRQRLRSAGLYDTAEDVIDKAALDLVMELYDEYLRPTRGRWLGLVHGHHWTLLRSGETSDQRLCQMLDARFLGTSAFIRLVFSDRANARTPVTLWVHHGNGGGSKPGAPLNKLEDMAIAFDADIYIMGHTTKRPAVPIDRIGPRWHGNGAPDLVHKTLYLVNAGGFSRGYARHAKQGRVPMGSYVEQGGMKPASLGAPFIRILPRYDYAGSAKRGARNGLWSPEISVEI